MELNEIKWEQHSHMTFSKFYLNTMIGELDGKKIYKHVKTIRTHNGNGIGKATVTYSETLESPDLTIDAVMRMIKKAKEIL